MALPTSATAAPDPITYMDTAARAATSVASDYKKRFIQTLDPLDGHVVLDLGCGPGTDLTQLADAVGPRGRVIGLDRDPAMLTEARRRTITYPNVVVQAGDLHALPLADASVDRVRTDRVLQHVNDPTLALDEARRVLRPAGLLGMAEPDWDTLTVADPDVTTSRRFARFITENQVRNASIGRQLPRLAAQAGFTLHSLDPIAVCFQDFATADMILGLRRNAARAIQAGDLTEEDATPWLHRLQSAMPFVAGFTFYLITAQAPA
jgi:ubiquinone/menaquinone biosynthesis C-methylase UbiE